VSHSAARNSLQSNTNSTQHGVLTVFLVLSGDNKLKLKFVWPPRSDSFRVKTKNITNIHLSFYFYSLVSTSHIKTSMAKRVLSLYPVNANIDGIV
jgi:hypothetical protein